MKAEYISAFFAALSTAFAVDAFRSRRKASRPNRREEIAAKAVAYAEQMGGTGQQKLLHAVSAFGRLDLADNGKRDFTDAEARISIEQVLKEKPK